MCSYFLCNIYSILTEIRICEWLGKYFFLDVSVLLEHHGSLLKCAVESVPVEASWENIFCFNDCHAEIKFIYSCSGSFLCSLVISECGHTSVAFFNTNYLRCKVLCMF